MFMKF